MSIELSLIQRMTNVSALVSESLAWNDTGLKMKIHPKVRDLFGVYSRTKHSGSFRGNGARNLVPGRSQHGA